MNLDFQKLWKFL